MTSKAVGTVGLTRSVGFQVGARRTFLVDLHAAWQQLLSDEGRQIWLGRGGDLRLEEGADYELDDGTTGQLRTLRPGSHLRLTFQPPVWPRSSTIQLRLIESKGKTVVAFHQEHLPDAPSREQRRRHFLAALEELRPLLE